MTLLLITSNVGAIFTGPTPAPVWVRTIAEEVELKNAGMVCLHMQEVGKDSKDIPIDFLRSLVENPVFDVYDVQYFVFDGKMALCSIYFINSKTNQISLLSSSQPQAVVPGTRLQRINLDDSNHGDLPKDKAPCKASWSHKGYASIKWRINNKEISTTNVHLPHDNCNIIALQSTPNPFALVRAWAVKYILDTLGHPQNHFVFGDFNFRPALQGVVRSVFAAVEKEEAQDAFKLVGGELSEKKFNPGAFWSVLTQCAPVNPMWPHDEGSAVQYLQEASVTFPPSYGYGPIREDGSCWGEKRCPAWADRIMMSKDTIQICDVHDYKLLARETPEIVDHKPVVLSLRIR